MTLSPWLSFNCLQEVALNLQLETNATEAQAIGTLARKDAFIHLARRHPATIALIEEITAQVNARTDTRAPSPTTPAAYGLVLGGTLSRDRLTLLGTLATANLVLVTAVLGLSRIMLPWIAGLLVSAAAALTTGVIALAQAKGGLARVSLRLPFLRKLAGRKFAQRLFAST
jgi:hypothetical protein